MEGGMDYTDGEDFEEPGHELVEVCMDYADGKDFLFMFCMDPLW